MVLVRVTACRDLGHGLADLAVAHAFAIPGPDLVEFLEGHHAGLVPPAQQGRRGLVRAHARGGEHPVQLLLAQVQGQGLGLHPALGRQGLAMPRQVQALHPPADHDLADGGIVGGTFAGLFRQDAAGHSVHAQPVLFLAHRLVDGFVIADAAHEARQGLVLGIARIFRQFGFVADAGIEQDGVFIDAFQKEHGMVREGTLDEGPPGPADIGGIQDGHVPFPVQPFPGPDQVLPADLLTYPAAFGIVRGIELRQGGFRPQQFAADVAIVEDG